jgi:hypothetical protein
VNPGSVRFDGTLYDAQNATGNTLATATTTSNIVAGQVNQVNLSFTSTTSATPAPVTGGSLTGVFSQLFSASSPFHKTVAQHKSEGAAVESQSLMTSLWSQGVASYGLGQSRQIPVYVASSSDPVKTISCTAYGQCDGNGKQIHVPAAANAQAIADGHIIVLDPTSGVEFDGWQCNNGSTYSCSWGGLYSLSGNGIHNNGSEGVHAGYAVGLFYITPQEIINGHIDHALGLNTSCLSSPNVYPADQNNGGSDANCGGTAHYGSLVHLLWTPAQIASSAYSSSCKVVLTALATYGAYTYDTGNGGLELATVGSGTFTGTTNPWTATVIPNMQAAGDASGGSWKSCLNRLSASDFELLAIKAGSY